MKKSIKKRFVFYIIVTVCFALNAVLKIIEYPERDDKGMQLFGIIIFGVMAVVYFIDAILLYRKKENQ